MASSHADDLLRSLPLAPLVEGLRTADAATLHRLVDDTLGRLDACEDDLRVMVPEPGRAERLHRDVDELVVRHADLAARPPLFGVIVGVKDIIAVDGLETRGGSALPPEAFAMPEASVVRRLRATGALVLGKTVTTEFASMGPGATANPHDVRHTPGGSSSGSAAGVAAGYFPLALGTQTGGSVTRPAAFCGIVGFKPSYGRIPADGVVAHAPSVDTVGCFAQDVAGVALAASVLLDDWQSEVSRRPARDTASLTCGVPDGAYLELADPVGWTAFEATIAGLVERGVTVRRIPFMSDAAEVLQRHAWMQDAEFAQSHRERFALYGSLYTGSAAAQFDRGRRVTDDQYRTGVQGRLELRRRLHATLDEQGLDLLLCPSAPGPAPRGLHTTGDPRMNSPWTQTGVPTVSLPAGLIEALPVGLQLVGRFGEDEALLAAAAILEPLIA